MDGFVEAAREGGAQVVSFFNKAADVGEALDRMPKPIGIMAHNDQQAAHLTAYCAQRRIPVPDQVAVVGVDNDASVCEITSPALSSVEPSSERIGYLAARLLDQLMSGEAPPPRPIVVAPRDVVTRGSSDVVTADPDLVTAVRFIREHANEPITAEDVARVALLSRRTLYRRFEAYFGRTVHEELTLARMARAKQMLSDTEMKVSDVAVRCGFRSLPHFTTMFGQVVGMSPTAYRKQFRPA
jgi:LacI family transcriptional regulator